MKLKFLPIIIIFIIWIVGISLDQYISFQQRNISINLVITNIEETPTGQWSLYNNEDSIDLRNYTFMSYEDIKIGDSISKKANEEKLYFYRKNLTTGKYERNLVLLQD